MPFITSGASLRRLPLFFAYCPDNVGVLSKRLEVRARHWERVKKETDEGLHGALTSELASRLSAIARLQITRVRP